MIFINQRYLSYEQNMFRIVSPIIAILLIFFEVSHADASIAMLDSSRNARLTLANTTLILYKGKPNTPNLKILHLQMLYRFSELARLYSEVNTKESGLNTFFSMHVGYRRKVKGRAVLDMRVFYDLLKKSYFYARGIDFYRSGTGFHRWGTGIAILDKKYAKVNLNAYFVTNESFLFKNIDVSSRVSDGFDIEGGTPFLPWHCKKRCKISLNYQWFNNTHKSDYRSIGANLDVVLYKGINMQVVYNKGLGSRGNGSNNDRIFITLTINTDRFTDVPVYRDKRMRDNEILMRSSYQYHPIKIENHFARHTR